MGRKFMIVFDLKINDASAEEKLRNMVKANFDNFEKKIRKCNELEIRYEEQKY